MTSTATMELHALDAFPDPPRSRQSSRPSSRSSNEDGPIFKFVTATKPEEFKDRDLMRGVRSHVMYHVVEGRHQKQMGPDARNTPKSSMSRKTRGGSSGSTASTSTTMTPGVRSVDSSFNSNNPETISKREALDIFAKYQRPRSATASQACYTPRSEGTPEGSSPESTRLAPARSHPKRQRTTPRSSNEQRRDEFLDEQVLVQPPQYGRMAMNPLFTAAQAGSFSSLHSDAQVTFHLANVFSPYDPFYTLPQPSDPRINVEQVKWYCHHYFGTKAMARAWLPQMIGSRESFLSTLGISTAHQDAFAERSEPSFMSNLVSAEATRLINAALADRWTRIRDSTIMSVCQLLASRVVTADKDELKRHEHGLRELIVERGGLDRLGVGGDLASVSCAMSYTSAILRESRPDPLFLYHRHEHKVYDNSAVLAESPLFCPRGRFITLSRSKSCIRPLLSLVQKLRDLTVNCAHLPTTTWTLDLPGNPHMILREIQALPYWDNLTQADLIGSPPTPSSPASSTQQPSSHLLHRYEATRLAAKLYAYSLAHRVPLSEAAAHYEGILSQLVSELKQSECPYSDCWGDMTGVLYWITLVGAAAAAAGSNANAAALTGVRRHERERRWLAALNIRCAIVLAFEHRAAMVGSLRTMVEAMSACVSEDGAATVSEDPLDALVLLR